MRIPVVVARSFANLSRAGEKNVDKAFTSGRAWGSGYTKTPEVIISCKRGRKRHGEEIFFEIHSMK